MISETSKVVSDANRFFDALIEGQLKLGQTIKQSELCDILGLSLSSLREVSVLLEAEGLIEVRKRMGVRIFYPDVSFVGNTFQYREVLECEGLRRFMDFSGRGWVEKTRKAHIDMIDFVRGVSDTEEYRIPLVAIEKDFHGTFIGAFSNEQISKNYDRAQQKMYLFRLLNPESVNIKNTVHSLNEHLDVIDAIENQDVEAAVAALKSHFSGVLTRTLTT
ncbi:MULTISPECIES: GntR family transcriptional regulator [Halocynthiibacter]|uniref:GntR family transcriptional regulator n=1 Tax=Halocynthiibacter halioticoli TaxID=2986804 RepID=A0AAE3LS45_9RHOB|nr:MULTISPECIES: GntR family transcriptional regulator [Halocynthiibacter]MCV6822941.1 GntR family transcriptional regulator [Halocynthiibacter halioticoli]MCW4055942.1 GntR family transcriptional regulator [Halocynthiibacter sp. SDUM655004]